MNRNIFTYLYTVFRYNLIYIIVLRYLAVERPDIKRTTTFVLLISTSDQATANGLRYQMRIGV